MSFEPVRRSAFEGYALPACARATPFGARYVLRGGEDVVAPVAGVLGVAPPTRPLGSASMGEHAALWLGPDEWLLIGESEDLGTKLEAALAGVFHSLVDVSHRQAGLAVTGPSAEKLLATGCPLDLDARAFPVGLVARTLFMKAEIALWRRGEAEFHLEVGRSFAQYVAHMLVEAARNQGEA